MAAEACSSTRCKAKSSCANRPRAMNEKLLQGETWKRET